jgi:hypothetical protein
MNSRSIGVAACALAFTVAPSALWAQGATTSDQDPVATTAAPAVATTTSQDPVATTVAPAVAGQVPGATTVTMQDGKIVSVNGKPVSVMPGQAAGWRSFKPNLFRPVDIQLKDATVRQAAEALTQASGIKIDVDSSVPRDLRMSVEAQRVSLRVVVETIAQQGNLMIGRDGDSLVFKTWPSLNVNGSRTYYKGPFDPWADEWGGRPGSSDDLTRAGFAAPAAGGFGGGIGFGPTGASGIGASVAQGGFGSAPAAGGFGGGGFGSVPASGGFGGSGGGGFGGGLGGGGFSTTESTPAVQEDGSVFFGAPQTSSSFPTSSFFSDGFHMASMGDKLVIAEPGRNSQGEPGIMLTVYIWDNGAQELRKLSSTFHRAGGGSRRTRAMGGGASSGRGRPGALPSTGTMPAAPGFFGRGGAALPPSPGGLGGGATTVTPGLPAPPAGAAPAPGANPSSPATPGPEPEVNDGATPVLPDPLNLPVPADPSEPL